MYLDIVSNQDNFPMIKKILTLFHVASEPTSFKLGEGEVSSPTSNLVIFKDRDLKFGDNAHFLIKVTSGTMPDF